MLKLFQGATRMVINVQKSTLSFTGMETTSETHYRHLFPFPTIDFSKGIKYLGFHLKPNDYWKNDWRWLLDKIEKHLKGWSFRWLSRVGILTLEKYVLEAIPFYWMYLAWIPKGILEKA